MSDPDSLYTSAVKAAALIGSKKLSLVDYLDAVLKAVDAAQPKLNCFRVVMAEEARRVARSRTAVGAASAKGIDLGIIRCQIHACGDLYAHHDCPG